MNLAAAAGRWSARHRKTAVLGWLLAVVLLALVGGAVGKGQLTNGEQATGESRSALRLLEKAGWQSHADESVLVQARDGRAVATDPAALAAVRAVVDGVQRTGRVQDVASPLGPNGSEYVSTDGRSLLVHFQVKGDADTADKRIGPVADAVAAVQQAHPQLRVEEVGDATVVRAVHDTVMKDFKKAELLSIPLTLGILLVAFGAFVAAFVPVLLALTAFVGAGGLLAVTSHLLHIDDTATSVMLLIGLAVGVDYSLFYIRREREERAAGRSADAALEAAAATSGRSVLVSGVTVIVAMAGMFFAGNGIYTGIGEATILVVAAAVIGSLTVLPALLSWLGDRIEKGRVPLVNRLRSTGGHGRVWPAVLRVTLRRPAVSAVLAVAALAALAVPAVGMQTTLPGPDDLPRNLPVMQTYARTQAAFPGGALPAVVAYQGDVGSPAVQDAVQRLKTRALATGLVREPVEVHADPARHVAVAYLPIAGSGRDGTSRQAIVAVRDITRQTLDAVPGVRAYVTGDAAASIDFNHTLKTHAPVVFAFVLVLAFVLLLVVFRSLVVAATSIVLNLLSVAAAYGVLVAVFQHGFGSSLIGLDHTAPIAAWLPLFLFVILFGLSMDYHVFILSRVKEERDKGVPTEIAVRRGITATAGTVTSAAVIMVAVFSTFATLSQISMKQVGFGLAVAVLLDATVIRGVLLPSAMTLLGERNWWLPRWLGWLPDVSLEHAPALPRQREVREPAAVLAGE